MTTTTHHGRAQRVGGTILKNVTSNWAGLVTNILLSFFMAPFIVNSLGSVYYGIWALLSQFTGYLWLFDFGVRESVIKYVAQYHATSQDEELSDTVNAALFLYGLIAGVTMLVTIGMAVALPYLFNVPEESVRTARLTLLINGAGIAEGFIFNVFVGVLMGLQRFYLVARLGILFSVLRALLTIFALSNGGGIIALSSIYLIVGTTANMIVYWLSRRSLPQYTPHVVVPGREQFGRVFGYAKYVLANNIGEKIVFSTDAFVIGMLLPVSMLTYYAIPASLVGYVKSIMLAMASVLNPASSALDATKDRKRLDALFLSACRGAVLIGMPICIGLILLGQRFIALWMGPSFAENAGPIIVVLGVAHLFGLPHYCISAVLYGLGRHRIMARWRAVEAAVNLVLSVILVRELGIVGAAIGTLIPHVVMTAVVLPYAMADVIGFRLRAYYVSTYGRPLLAAVPFIMVCRFIDAAVRPQSLLAFVAIGAMAMPVYIVPAWFALAAPERDSISKRVRLLLPSAARIRRRKSLRGVAGTHEV